MTTKTYTRKTPLMRYLDSREYVKRELVRRVDPYGLLTPSEVATLRNYLGGWIEDGMSSDTFKRLEASWQR